MLCVDLYLLYTPANGSKPYVRYHRVWDKERFIQARRIEGMQCKPEERFIVEVTTKPPFGKRG